MFDVRDVAIREGQTALETLSKELVWRSLYGHKKFDDAQLRRLSSELTGLAMKFLAVEANERQPNTEWLSLQSLLEKPELHKHRASVERQLQRYFEEEDTPSSQHLLDQHLMHWNTFNQAAKTFSSGDYADKLEPADFYLECFYLSRKMKSHLAWLSFQNFRSTQVKIELIPGLSDYLAHPRFSRFPLLKVYRQILLSLSEPDEEAHFDHLLEMLEREGGQINREDLRECYHIAQNYCALKINQGKTRYYQLVFRIYQELIASGLLLESGQLSEGAYKNIITISLQVGAYEWAEHFVQTHWAFLPASIRENAHSYNLASRTFTRKNLIALSSYCAVWSTAT